MPVRPPLRAGHDVSLTVNIDTGDGGPGIIDVQSDLHEIAGWNGGAHQAGDVPRKATIALKNQREIPNRDFVLRWRCESDAIQEAVFTHADPKWIDRVEVPALTDIIEQGAAPGMTALSSGGGFFTIVIAPPARVDDVDVLPRELIFVLDTSGSMSGQPIEKAKDVMSRAIDAMRPGDTFNMITFSGDTRILWNAPRPNTQTNRDEAQRFLASQAGNGGTEMMSAINVALAPTPRHAILGAEPAALTPLQLANLPADGREVVVAVDAKTVEAHDDPEPSIDSTLIPVNERVAIRARWLNQLRPWLIERENARGDVHLRGKWSTINGERVLEVAEIVAAPMQRDPDIEPMRVVMFLTDGQVGNDDAIIAAVREHAKTTRVFSFGIGDSPNRYLLDGIAQAGRGESEYVNLNNNPDESVQRFVKRIASPVLRDIEIVLSEGLQNGDTVPALDAIPDLWDVKPLIIHGRYPIADGAGAKPPSGQAQSGTITIRGKTMRGEYALTIDITLPQRSNRNPMLPALWARGKIDQIIASDINIKRNGGMVANASAETRNAIVALGERYHIASNFTSFVAVEKTRITVGGQSVLVPVPIELPEGMEWEGVFGGEGLRRRDGSRLAQLQQGRAPPLAVSRIGWKAQVAQMLTFEADAGLNEFGLTNRFLMEGAEAGTHGDGFANEWWYLAGDSAGDPSTGLVNVNTAPAAMLNPNLAYRFSTTGNFAHAPGLDLDAALSQGQQNSPPIVEFAWQNSSPRDFATGGDAMFVDGQDEPFVTDTNAGNGGGGGGFGGGGGGGGIFGEAGNDPARLATPEDLRHSLIDVIQETINPDGWSDLGGDLAELTIENGVFNFRTLKDSPSAQQTVERARGFLTMLAAAIPEVAEVAKVDVPPTQPFDPVADMTPLDETDPDGPVAAGDPAPNAHLIIYDVRDVITVIRAVGPAGEAEAVDQLVDLITSVVAPDHWDVNGGDLGHIQSLKGNLIVTIGPEQHQAIAGLLAKIRAAIAARQHVPEHGAASPQDVAGDAAQRATLVYDVHDLVESLQQPATRNDCLQQLVDTIAETVTPDDWDINGGDVASWRVIEDLLIVTHTHDGHVGVGDALQQLRDTGHIQQPLPAERQPADWPGPRPQTQGAVWKDRLHFTRVPIAFRNDSLEQIFAFFEQVTGLDFAVDWEALAAIGVKPENTVTLQMTDTPMTTALERVLESVGEDGQHPVFIGKDATLLITSPDALPKDEQASAAAIEAVAKAEAAMRERLLEALRHEARLRRVIDQRLWTAVVAAKQNEVALSEAERTLTPALSHPPAGERGMPIVILVNAVDDATVDALKSHGLRIDDRNTRMKLVAGAIDAAKLTDLASLECVRRIEPIVIAP
jgi:hypothetical protein